MTFSATACRTLVVAGAAAAALASGSSNQNRPDTASAYAAPAPQPMDPARAVGLWKSSFGPVKIERDDASGPGHVSGVWVYERAGEQVIGYFDGPLDGNVLQFRWHEPATPSDLTGQGYLVFDQAGRSFTGRWWTTARDRGGPWEGWRGDAAPPGPGPAETGPAEQAPPADGGRTNDGMPPSGPAEQAPPAEPAPGDTI